ncbi:MAG TPA: hypothetical protein VGM91_00645 [Conexibacter sp.]
MPPTTALPQLLVSVPEGALIVPAPFVPVSVILPENRQLMMPPIVAWTATSLMVMLAVVPETEALPLHGSRNLYAMPAQGSGVIVALVTETAFVVALAVPEKLIAQLVVENGVANVRPPAGNEAVIAPPGEMAALALAEAKPAAATATTATSSARNLCIIAP